MNSTPISAMILVLVASVIGSFGAVFLKLGAAKLKHGLVNLFGWRLALGVVFFLLSSLFFVTAIKRGELSVLYPIVSVGNIWTLLWSRIVFREPITRQKSVAVGLILLGVFLVGLRSKA
jgi:undecaprenyl phosphate-alpha-L-ara4N flippase subunit ArnE